MSFIEELKKKIAEIDEKNRKLESSAGYLKQNERIQSLTEKLKIAEEALDEIGNKAISKTEYTRNSFAAIADQALEKIRGDK
jgi:hypothetical protein